MNMTTPPSTLPKIRTSVVDRAIRHRAADGTHDRDDQNQQLKSEQQQRQEGRDTPPQQQQAISGEEVEVPTTPRFATSGATPTQLGTFASSRAAASSPTTASPSVTDDRAWLLTSRLRDLLKRTSVGNLLKAKAAATRTVTGRNLAFHEGRHICLSLQSRILNPESCKRL